MELNFQNIYNILEDYLPNKWKKIAIYYSFFGNSAGGKFYINNGKGFIDCFQLGYQQKDIIKSLMQIQNIIDYERSKLPKNKQFTEFEMIVDQTGKFNVNYGYDDISEISLKRQQEWEDKNIKGKN